MAKFEFTAKWPLYYPNSGLFAKPGEVHDLDVPPDGNWKPVDGAVSAPEPVPAPVPTPAPADPVATAEALLEANPALAAQIVEEAAKNA